MFDDPVVKDFKNIDLDLQRVSEMNDEEIIEVLQNLSVHQTELEMQNEQLRLTQEDLKISQQRAYQIFYNAPTGYVTLDDQGIVKQCNRKFTELVDIQDVDVIGHAFIEFLSQSDRVTYNVWKRSSSVDKVQTFQFHTSNVKALFLSISMSELVVDKAEKVTLVTCSDVSELKASEEALKISSIVFENANEAAMVVNSNFEIISINPAFTKITGYTKEEIINQNPSLLSSGQHDSAFYRDLYNALNKKGCWEGEIWNRRKDGQIYPEWLSINVITDLYDNPYQYVCVFKDNTQYKTDQYIIHKQATHDALTDLPNRVLFNDRLEQAILHSIRNTNEMAVLFIDLDGFKDVNDTLGHHSGDLLLKEVALRLKNSIRETDTVARLGGDEFAIILLDIKAQEDIKRTLFNILEIVKHPFVLSDDRAYVTASIGVTLYPHDGDSSQELLMNADQAMYSAKRMGKNCFKFFTEQMQASASVKHQISNDLRSGDTSDFYLNYQPIVDILSGQIVKAEALLRWKHPKGETIGPDVFIPIAEENGYILELGDFVFDQVTNDLASWHKRYGINIQIGVNTSPMQFKINAKSAQRWIQKLLDLNLSGANLVIEITEGLLLESTHVVDEVLLAFRDFGLEVALDDFGTGYSSLAYLRKFDIDYLKIDKSFVSLLESDPDSLVLCEAIILMAHKLGMKVIAEGVETAFQREQLISVECDYGQGYLFSYPLPKDQFEQLLLNESTPFSPIQA
ncbi:EAL domain-containing protein [uncultured Amphritea sp.]|uniref:sensor domain-containing protein n=1 Tax=uncultured Amphritea sp. TaxID=981605 RepID=UPI00260EFD4D|nr:EAL domain-containing protein [uncultured Amphritea sp.]